MEIFDHLFQSAVGSRPNREFRLPVGIVATVYGKYYYFLGSQTWPAEPNK